MKIIRAERHDTALFMRAELDAGACCFYTEDRETRYFFQISGQEAVLYASGERYIDEAVEQFLFYSGFVTMIMDANGRVIRQRRVSALQPLAITSIQPSQFYINRSKLDNCKKWMKAPKDVMIPVALSAGEVISLDGHTRLRAALDLGFQTVYTYQESYDASILRFVEEAKKRGVYRVADMEMVSDEEYKIKWDQFCDDFISD